MAGKIYTKKGDKGETSLFDGKRLPKNHIRIEAYGTVDELNSFIGLLRDGIRNELFRDILSNIQNQLFVLGSHLAAGSVKESKLPVLPLDAVQWMEETIDQIQSDLPQLRNFILPGGDASVSLCHVCRTVSRRAERRVVNLMQNEEVDEYIVIYLNRLSDLLFVLSRMISKSMGISEITWIPEKPKK